MQRFFFWFGLNLVDPKQKWMNEIYSSCPRVFSQKKMKKWNSFIQILTRVKQTNRINKQTSEPSYSIMEKKFYVLSSSSFQWCFFGH